MDKMYGPEGNRVGNFGYFSVTLISFKVVYR